MKQVFADGRRVARKIACEDLMAITNLRQAACYHALSLNGRFKEHLVKWKNCFLGWNDFLSFHSP